MSQQGTDSPFFVNCVNQCIHKSLGEIQFSNYKSRIRILLIRMAKFMEILILSTFLVPRAEHQNV